MAAFQGIFSKLKTSSLQPPYYSIELNLLSSTSHLLTPRSAHNWFAASAERKFILKVEKSMNPEVSWCFSIFSRFLNFSSFLMVLGWSGNEILFPGSISCPGLVSNLSALGLNFKLVQARACPNSFFRGWMFRSRCLGHSQTCRYARPP